MKRKSLLLGLAIASAVVVNAHAEDSGPYLGISVGQATDEANGFEDDGVAFKLYGGGEINRYLAVELSYIDAGKLRDTVDGLDITVESSGFAGSLLGKLPLGDSFALFAKVGYVIYDEKVTARLGSLSESEKNNADDPLYGVGAELDLGSRFKLRAEYEIVDIPNADFELVTIGGTLHF